jgi:quercetin dioxygenase-like cupin family protein
MSEKNPPLDPKSRLADLVNYQPGAVVSRTLIDKSAGTVTVFAFAPGQGLSEHTAPYDALILGVEGQAEIMLSGDTNLVEPDDLIFMRAGEAHSVKAITEFKMLLIMIRE